MKKYLSIDSKCLMKLADCFVNTHEFEEFLENFIDHAEELKFLRQYAIRMCEKEEGSAMSAKMIVILALFFQQHIEVIHQIIRNLDFTVSDSPPKKSRKIKKKPNT